MTAIPFILLNEYTFCYIRNPSGQMYEIPKSMHNGPYYLQDQAFAKHTPLTFLQGTRFAFMRFRVYYPVLFLFHNSGTPQIPTG